MSYQLTIHAEVEHRVLYVTTFPGGRSDVLVSHTIRDFLLIGRLSRAAAKGRLERALEPFLHPHVLVIDKLGYLSHATDAANVSTAS